VKNTSDVSTSLCNSLKSATGANLKYGTDTFEKSIQQQLVPILIDLPEKPFFVDDAPAQFRCPGIIQRQAPGQWVGQNPQQQ
jgi:hypothetical protein